MQMNKNGIPVQTKTARQQRANLLEDKKLRMKRYVLIDEEAEVEIVVPHFSPIVAVLEKDGWRELK
ncbi:hypothetical protein [Solibacillus cecembensis]|uniref:hypothetical protein n=1 Tax=Solibacillus cecembensis TaxID=459347 RepID=UPI003CFD5D3A